MTREQKIKVLQQIVAGHSTIEDLEPPIDFIVFIFGGPKVRITVAESRRNPNPTLEFNLLQYQQWKENFERVNEKRKVPHNLNEIIFEQTENCKDLYECKGLENCLYGCGCIELDKSQK